MKDALVLPASSDLATLKASAFDYAKASKAKATKVGYGKDWRAFERWCASTGVQAFPAAPEIVMLYITWLADQGKKVATINRALTAISQRHKLGGMPSPRISPLVSETLRGIKRTLGVAQVEKAPVLIPELRKMVEEASVRDRAILALGFAGALRRSEIVALECRDLHFKADGLVLMIRQSKTDQEGEGEEVGVPYGGHPMTCGIRTTLRWLELSGVKEGKVFRQVTRHGKIKGEGLTPQTIALIVKKAAERAGIDPMEFSGHSLRAGLATSAAKAGKSERSIMKQTRHKSPAMARRYIRRVEIFEDNAAAGIGL